MNGKMLWFNAEKGFGFIHTEDEERLYVAHDGFEPGQVPAGRCAGRDVVFERRADETGAQAVNVVFPPQADARRARRRQGSRGHSI